MAAVVRLSREERVLLDKEFYSRCLVALRQWGQDPQAITDVYWALRQCDGGCGGEEKEEAGPVVGGGLACTVALNQFSCDNLSGCRRARLKPVHPWFHSTSLVPAPAHPP